MAETMAERHKKLKTMPACMKHMTSVMKLEPEAARNRCSKLIKKNKGNTKTSKPRSNSSGSKSGGY